MKRWIIAGMLVSATACAGVATPSGSSVVEATPQGPDVDFEVLECSVEYGFATALVEFTVSEPYSYVEFVGDYIDEDGVSIGQGLGNATDVVPNQVYRLEVLYSLHGKGSGGTCHVRVGDLSR